MKKKFNNFYNSTFVRIVMTIWPIITGPYYLCLDVFGSQWAWIKLHPVFHQYLFTGCIIVGVLGAFLVAIHSWINKSEFNYTQDVLNCFNTVVKLKKTRFLAKLNNISPCSNIFKIITHPKDQITQSSMEYCNLLSRIFNIPVDDIDITIIDYSVNPPTYFFQNRLNVKHTNPQQLLSEKSVAAKCKKEGTSIYIADKEAASAEESYYLSKSDKGKKGGSAFCYPVLIDSKNIKAQYLITITTYGKKFSDSVNDVDENSTKMILLNIAARIELELELQSIKNYMK